jgi:hypothetical protein
VATIAIRFYLSGTDMTPLVVDTMAAEPLAKSDADSAVKAWNANSASLAGWIEEIGALKARVAELEAVAPPAEAPAGVA